MFAENIVVQDNIFMNDFAGSGRTNGNDTGAYIVVKDSNGAADRFLGSRNILIRRNIFLNREGSSGSNFVLIGEDGQDFYEAEDVTIENNLMLGNSANVMRAPFGVKGGRDITFNNNTISGDLPALAFAMRFNCEGADAVIADPDLGSQAAPVLPRWDPVGEIFEDGSATICQAFDSLVQQYGTPGSFSTVDRADSGHAPGDDILGNARGTHPDIGAVEIQ